MNGVPLNYFINLFITEEIIKFYNLSHKKNEMEGLNVYFTWFNYVDIYISSNSNYPEKIEMLIWNLNKALGLMYGFNSGKAIECIINYFVDNDYNKYLNLVIEDNKGLVYKK
jgi:hypothetical protein